MIKAFPIIFYTFENEDIIKSYDLSQSNQVKRTVYLVYNKIMGRAELWYKV